MSLSKSSTLIIAVSAIALLAVSCGRKSDLDPPGMPLDQQNNKAVTQKPVTADKPFILDPLL